MQKINENYIFILLLALHIVCVCDRACVTTFVIIIIMSDKMDLKREYRK